MHPLLEETPKVVINGEEITLPRITISTTFKITRFLNKVLGRDLLEALTGNEDQDEAERGMVIIQVIFERLGGAEQELYDLLANVLKMTPEEVENITIEEMAMLVDALKEHPDVGFIKTQVTKALKSQ